MYNVPTQLTYKKHLHSKNITFLLRWFALCHRTITFHAWGNADGIVRYVASCMYGYVHVS